MCPSVLSLKEIEVRLTENRAQWINQLTTVECQQYVRQQKSSKSENTQNTSVNILLSFHFGCFFWNMGQCLFGFCFSRLFFSQPRGRLKWLRFESILIFLKGCFLNWGDWVSCHMNVGFLCFLFCEMSIYVFPYLSIGLLSFVYWLVEVFKYSW